MPRRTYALHLGTGSALTALKTANTLHTKCTLSFISISIWYPQQNWVTAACIFLGKLPTLAVTFVFSPLKCQVKVKRLSCPYAHQDGIQWQGRGRLQFVCSFLTSVGEERGWLASSSGSFTAIVTAPDIHCKGGCFCPSVEFSRQIFEKYPNIKFYEDPFRGSGVVLCGRTDRQTWQSS